MILGFVIRVFTVCCGCLQFCFVYPDTVKSKVMPKSHREGNSACRKESAPLQIEWSFSCKFDGLRKVYEHAVCRLAPVNSLVAGLLKPAYLD